MFGFETFACAVLFHWLNVIAQCKADFRLIAAFSRVGARRGILHVVYFRVIINICNSSQIFKFEIIRI